MHTGPLVRKPKNEKKYLRHIAHKQTDCDFCNFSIQSEQVVAEHVRFWLVINLFPYDMWDGMGVVEHLLLVPKRHVDSIAHFKPSESKEFVALLARYEAVGYSLYARAPQSTAKSIPHQHTHLIKMNDKKVKALLYIRKPHMLLAK